MDYQLIFTASDPEKVNWTVYVPEAPSFARQGEMTTSAEVGADAAFKDFEENQALRHLLVAKGTTEEIAPGGRITVRWTYAGEN